MNTDNSAYLTSIAESLALIAKAFESVDNTLSEILSTNRQILEAPLTSIADSFDEMVHINNEILNRIKTKNLGIYMRQVEDAGSELTRAITVNALKRSDQLKEVAEEIVRPTPVP